MPVQIPHSDVRNVESSVAIKKPHTMTSLYLEPIKTPNVEPNVVTSAKGPIVLNDVGSVGTSEKYASETVSIVNPRAEKTLGQSSLNVVVNDTINKSIHVSLSKILVGNPKSGVVPDVATSLSQLDHSVETIQEKSHGESDNESVPIESPEKSQKDVSDKNSQEDVSEDELVGGEKGDSDDESMSFEGEKDMSDKEDKEESIGVKKYWSTDIVNVDNLDSDDEPIGNNLAPSIDKRLNNRKGKVVVSSSKPSKASKKSVSVGPVKGWSKVLTPATKKRSLKRKEVLLSEPDYDVEQNIQDIMPSTKKGVAGKKIPANVLEVIIDNVSFHSVENVEKWTYVYQRRLALRRKLGKDALECKEVVNLIEAVGLMKSVTGFGNYYEMLMK